MKGVITKIISNQYQVTNDNTSYNCIARGKVRLQSAPLVGDYVEFEEFSGQYGIEKLYPRHNEMKRPKIANVDQVLIVMSAIDPEFSNTLVDRLSFLINYEGLSAALIVTKLDLVSFDHFVFEEIKNYRKAGFKVVDAHNLPELLDLFADKISVLTGQSGVGKSTCLNRLNNDFNLATQEISKALNRGKHTTRFTCLYPIGSGWVADTPGFSALEWKKIDLNIFSQAIQGWQKYIGKCKYRNCLHDKEPGCIIKSELLQGIIVKSRYENYQRCLEMIKKENN
ncbi:MAG: ribosome small subunit-dependent GTPase A [Erysipelotrichaceae bacterium]